MKQRRGFTLLEATIAMAIVGLVAVVALSEFSTEVRVSAKASESRVLQALAQDRLTALQLAPPEVLHRLPDSLKTGKYAPPFQAYSWQATVRPVRSVESLLDASITVVSKTGQLTVATRFHRPLPRVEQKPR